MNDDTIEIGYDTKEYIITELVEPYYKQAIKSTINGKRIWRLFGISLETVSKILVAVGGIFSFSAGYYHDDTLSFVSGSISCMSLAMLQLSSFSYKENKKQSQELNTLLKKLNLETVPLLDRCTQSVKAEQRKQEDQWSVKGGCPFNPSIDTYTEPETPPSNLQAFNVSPQGSQSSQSSQREDPVI